MNVSYGWGLIILCMFNALVATFKAENHTIFTLARMPKWYSFFHLQKFLQQVCDPQLRVIHGSSPPQTHYGVWEKERSTSKHRPGCGHRRACHWLLVWSCVILCISMGFLFPPLSTGRSADDPQGFFHSKKQRTIQEKLNNNTKQ